MKKVNNIYIIYRIDPKTYHTVNDDLKRFRLSKKVKSIVPCIQYVTINSNKKTLSKVPLLFNYGFLKISTKLAFNREFINKLIKKIPGILSIVSGPSPIHDKRGRKPRITDMMTWDDYSKPAYITREEIKRLLSIARTTPLYSHNDLSLLKSGDLITLKGYPWEGIQVILEDIILRDKVAIIKFMQMEEDTNTKLKVPLENTVYSIYTDYDEESRDETYEEYLDRNYQEGPEEETEE